MHLEKGESVTMEDKKNVLKWRKWGPHIVTFNKLEQDDDIN